MSAARQNVELAGARRADFENYVTELEARVATLGGDAGEGVAAATEHELQALADALRSWQFGSQSGDKGAPFCDLQRHTDETLHELTQGQ